MIPVNKLLSVCCYVTSLKHMDLLNGNVLKYSSISVDDFRLNKNSNWNPNFREIVKHLHELGSKMI